MQFQSGFSSDSHCQPQMNPDPHRFTQSHLEKMRNRFTWTHLDSHSKERETNTNWKEKREGGPTPISPTIQHNSDSIHANRQRTTTSQLVGSVPRPSILLVRKTDQRVRLLRNYVSFNKENRMGACQTRHLPGKMAGSRRQPWRTRPEHCKVAQIENLRKCNIHAGCL